MSRSLSVHQSINRDKYEYVITQLASMEVSEKLLNSRGKLETLENLIRNLNRESLSLKISHFVQFKKVDSKFPKFLAFPKLQKFLSTKSSSVKVA